MKKRRSDHSFMIRILAVSLYALCFINCSSSLAQYKEVGEGGNIDSAASVKGFASMEIDAPIQDVWEILIQAKEWPEWNPEIKSVRVDGPLVVGKKFEWGPAFPKIKSEVVLFNPQRQLIWVGSMLHLKAIHSWNLIEKDGLTIISTEESLDGKMVTWIFGKKKLDKSLEKWLISLKKRVELNGSNKTSTAQREYSNG